MLAGWQTLGWEWTHHCGVPPTISPWDRRHGVEESIGSGLGSASLNREQVTADGCLQCQHHALS